MTERLAPVEIPDKSSFKAAEVCELLQVPTYVLRTWENEFKDLGVAKGAGAARTYRRSDVELAFRIKDLVFSEHLTLAGVRRRLEQEGVLKEPEDEEVAAPAASAAQLAGAARERLTQVKNELRSLLVTLSGGHPPVAARGGRGTAATEAASPAVPGAEETAPASKGQGRAGRRGVQGGPSLLPGFDAGEAHRDEAPSPAGVNTGERPADGDRADATKGTSARPANKARTTGTH